MKQIGKYQKDICFIHAHNGYPRTSKMALNSVLKDFPAIICVWLYLFITFYIQIAESKIGYFWHITDLHFDPLYSTKGDVLRSCWHSEHHQSPSPLTRSPGHFGDYMCDSPWSLLESATQTMKARQGDNVEFVLWTGDGLSHSSRRLHETHRLDLIRNITDLLGRTFPSQFVFPVLGHEDGLNDNFNRLGDLWRHWLPVEALQTFEKGGYYTIEQTKSRLRIIALNTNYMRHDVKYTQSHLSAVKQRPDGSTNYNNYYYHHGKHYQRDNDNRYMNGLSSSSSSSSSSMSSSSASSSLHPSSNYNSHDGGGTVSALSGNSHESEKQWEWFEEMLAKSSRNKETVYIVGHIPPGSDERQIGIVTNGHTTYTEKNNLRYLRLIRKYSSIIQGQFFGHLHSDSFRVVYNDVGKPVSWIMMAPSVTPRKMNIGSNNPAMRLYKFDTDTGQVLDYTQFYLDLATANLEEEATWQLEYNLTSYYYGLGEVSSVALHNLADRLTSSEDAFFAKYYRANSVRYSTQQCEGVCSLNHYCAITRLDYREYRQCLETAASALASNSRQIQFYNSSILLICSIVISNSIFQFKKSMHKLISGVIYFLFVQFNALLICFCHLALYCFTWTVNHFFPIKIDTSLMEKISNKFLAAKFIESP